MAPLTTYPLDCGKHQILTLDADEYGNFIALLSNGEVWTNSLRLPLRQVFRSPIIREIDENRFLVIDAGTSLTDNGFIFDNTGHALVQFNAGSCIEDVLIQAGQIVISYFDQGVLSFQKPSSDGIAVFDLAGQQLYGLNSSQQYFMLDCYGLCRQGKDSILAYSYTEFPLLELCLTDYRLLQQSTPTDFEGSHALTTSYGNVIFYASYEDKSSFFWWNRKEKVKRFGHFEAAFMRGIGMGKFLTYDQNSFTIVDAMELMGQEVSRV